MRAKMFPNPDVTIKIEEISVYRASNPTLTTWVSDVDGKAVCLDDVLVEFEREFTAEQKVEMIAEGNGELSFYYARREAREKLEGERWQELRLAWEQVEGRAGLAGWGALRKAISAFERIYVANRRKPMIGKGD